MDDDSVTIYSPSGEHLPDPPSYNELELGDTWRQAAIKRCPICHSLTNKWELGGYPSSGPRCYCPVTKGSGGTLSGQDDVEQRYEAHQELEELCQRRKELVERLKRYDSTTAAGERTQERLHDELKVLDEQIADLRAWFDGRFNDVVGVDPATAEVIDMQYRSQ